MVAKPVTILSTTADLAADLVYISDWVVSSVASIRACEWSLGTLLYSVRR